MTNENVVPVPVVEAAATFEEELVPGPKPLIDMGTGTGTGTGTGNGTEMEPVSGWKAGIRVTSNGAHEDGLDPGGA